MRAVVAERAPHSLRRFGVATITAVFIASSAVGQSIGSSGNSIVGTVTILDQDGEEIADRSGVVAFIDGVPNAAKYRVLPKPPQVSHKDQQFTPRVLPIVRGTTVDFFNDDHIYHNVFSLSESKTFDLGIYPEGTSKLVDFPETGLVKIHCNIHPRMISSILVLNNSFFATTGTDGHFEIVGIPDGKFTLRLWSEFVKEQSRTVTLSRGRRLEESFEIKRIGNFVQHTNKFGKRYREKY